MASPATAVVLGSGGRWAVDRITLHAVEVWARHGVLPAERERGQPFLVHASIDLDTTDAAASDELGDTVDYAQLAREVADEAAAGPHQLIETVADRVAQRLLRHDRVHAVEVTVEKPHAPLPVPTGGVSVTVHRERRPQQGTDR